MTALLDSMRTSPSAATAIGDGGGGEDAAAARGPQSVQSVPNTHMPYSAPEPPSSQSPSLLAEHVLEHVVLES